MFRIILTEPRLRRLQHCILAALVASPLTLSTAWARQKPDEDAETRVKVFKLGALEVHADAQNDPTDLQRLDQTDLERANANTVADAVRLLPGVSLTRNSRNEEILYLRGFDSRQVPVYVDGIPLYVPYDGYVDFARFTIFDLAEIQVTKSGASLLYGPNTLGGAVNLITRKSVNGFEGDLRIGLGSGYERKAAINLGGNQGRWYYQTGISYLDADSFPLPKDFEDYKPNPTDTGNYRANAKRRDRRLSFKLGLTPNETDEYAAGFVRQEGEKDNPVYTGRSALRNAVRYWRWPYWDKDSLYFLSTTAMGDSNTLKTKVYRDTYTNGLDMYADAGYIERAPTSRYDDESRGAGLEWNNTSLNRHKLSLALHYKRDEHTDAAVGNDPEKYYRDVTTSIVLEDHITLSEQIRLTVGLSRDRRDAHEAYHWPTGATRATNGVLKLDHELDSDGNALYAVLSRKTRFPTIKDRYSARMGRALPNPDLKPESALHFEIGAAIRPWHGGQMQASLFYSRVRDKIQTQIVSSDACGGTACDQAQNVGRTRSMGAELSLDQSLGELWSMDVAYTYLHRANLSNRSIGLTGTPRQRLMAGLQWQPLDEWQLRAEAEAETGRRMPVGIGAQSQVQQLPGYGIVNLRAYYQPRENLGFDFGLTNVNNKWYEWTDGLPMPGQAWYVNANYRF